MGEVVQTQWTKQGEAFDCLLHDDEFRAIVGLPSETTDGSAAGLRSSTGEQDGRKEEQVR